jgi:hypothetical protein
MFGPAIRGGRPGVAVQGFGDKLGNEAADELAYGAAQLVTNERLERLLGKRGHACQFSTWATRMRGRSRLRRISRTKIQTSHHPQVRTIIRQSPTKLQNPYDLSLTT